MKRGFMPLPDYVEGGELSETRTRNPMDFQQKAKDTIAWDILRDYSDMFLSCPDYVSVRGIRMLANPVGDDDV